MENNNQFQISLQDYFLALLQMVAFTFLMSQVFSINPTLSFFTAVGIVLLRSYLQYEKHRSTNEEDRIQQLNIKMEQAVLKIKTQYDEIVGLRSSQATIQNENRVMTEELFAYKQSLQDFESKHRASTKDLSETVTILEKNAKSKDEALRRLEAENAQLRNRLASSQDDITKKRIGDLKRSLAAYKKSGNQARIKETESLIEQLENSFLN
ncbi:MAG: hypothetical protein EAY81_00055 [Bacteroidetes bacterium]|nr:MAG: hypothetical protein EAY81_00055 [Bacteroidota bacterium]